MHDEIIRYSLDGKIKDDNIVQAKERMVEFLENQMREFGCVPSIDLDPQFTLDYRPESESYDFALTVYGIFVGEEQAWRHSGVTSGKQILRHK